MGKLITRGVAVIFGALLAFGLLAIPSASAQTSEPCLETTFEEVTFNTFDLIPAEYNRAEQLVPTTAIRLEAVTTTVACAEDPEDPDEVLAEVVTMAVTGSNIDLPVAVGLSLIGAGGLALMAARKREDKNS